MKEENGKMVFNATFVVDKYSKGLNDIYVTIEEFDILCRHFGQNRCEVAFRMKGIG